MTKEQKKKNEEELMEEGLKAIYGDQKKQDFATFEKGKNRLTSFLVTIITTLTIVATVGWGGFFAYTKYFAPQTTERFTLAIEAPKQLKSGELAEIIIQYSNPTSVPITGLEIDVRLPPLFIVEDLSPTPANIEDQIWSLGTLSPGSDGIIIAKGIWIAQNPSSTPIQVLANYRPANFNADFQDIETFYIETHESTLEVAIKNEEEVRPGEPFEITIELTNSGPNTLTNIETALVLPNGFFLEDSEPSIEPGTAPVWKFETIDAETTEIIELSGSFAADVKGFQFFNTQTFIHQNNRKLAQTTGESFVDVLGSDLSVALVANGGTDTVFQKENGSIRTTITFENTGTENISNASLALQLQANETLPILWNNAQLNGGRISTNAVLFDNATVGTLEPGERKTFNVNLPLNSTISQGQADEFTLVAVATRNTLEIKSSPIEVKIQTQGTLKSVAKYYNATGAPLGNGPMPPKVGEKTSYRIYWSIENALHDLENIEVTATLPPNVSWEDQLSTPLGTISYDATTKTIRWRIDKITTSIPSVESYFTVSVTPSNNDVGKFLKLTSESTLRATDAKNKSPLESTVEGQTTELPQDEFAEGKGIVIE